MSIACSERIQQDPRYETTLERQIFIMAKVIGLDLGTTNSCVAVMEGGEPVVIANAVSDALKPFGAEFNSLPIRWEDVLAVLDGAS